MDKTHHVPEPNPGQTKVGKGYTVLDGGQDAVQAGWYFSERTHALRYFRAGDRVPDHGPTREHWDYLTDDETADREALVDILRERGWGGDPSVIHLG